MDVVTFSFEPYSGVDGCSEFLLAVLEVRGSRASAHVPGYVRGTTNESILQPELFLTHMQPHSGRA
jgi:hypothetical protein